MAGKKPPKKPSSLSVAPESDQRTLELGAEANELSRRSLKVSKIGLIAAFFGVLSTLVFALMDRGESADAAWRTLISNSGMALHSTVWQGECGTSAVDFDLVPSDGLWKQIHVWKADDSAAYGADFQWNFCNPNKMGEMRAFARRDASYLFWREEGPAECEGAVNSADGDLHGWFFLAKGADSEGFGSVFELNKYPICLRTNAGRLAEVKIDEVYWEDFPADTFVYVHVTVWERI